MKKSIKNVTCKITEVGNFNKIVKSWYLDDELMNGVELEVNDVVNIKEYEDPMIPGGEYSVIKKMGSDGKLYSTSVLGRLIFNREDDDYIMKNDRHRLLYTTRLK